MTSTEMCAEQTRSDRMREIERKHFGRCLWQVIPEGRRAIVECVDFPAAKTTAIVVKQYERSIPRSGSGKPWPELMASYVYLPTDETNTWDGLDAALTAQYK